MCALLGVGNGRLAVRDGPRGPRTLCNNCGYLYERDKKLPPWSENLFYLDRPYHDVQRSGLRDDSTVSKSFAFYDYSSGVSRNMALCALNPRARVRRHRQGFHILQHLLARRIWLIIMLDKKDKEATKQGFGRPRNANGTMQVSSLFRSKAFSMKEPEKLKIGITNHKL